MLGTIISIDDNILSLKLNVSLDEFQNILNMYVIIEDEDQKVVGEVISIKNEIAQINLL